MTPLAQAADRAKPFLSKGKWSQLSTSYFRSGWAFLIPYLIAYLFYAWMRWPVNPTAGWIPSLLYVYWFLHVLHFFLGVATVLSWWRTKQHIRGVEFQFSSSNLSHLWPIVPWLLLALIFWIPGVYLEWPSDPWEHLRRINEWRGVDIVTSHSTWTKSSYFIPYSLLNWSTGLRQIFWLDFYYAAICLLLCWQYYRLAVESGLGKRTSMTFVLLQTLLAGNNIFSFYRYYGISSSIYAQLGAVALTRIALEAANTWKGQYYPSLDAVSSYKIPFGSFYRLFLSCTSLCAFILLNHQQGIGIAALGMASVFIWRLAQWRRSALGWIVVIVVASNVFFLQYYHRPLAIENYRSNGYLNTWYGFNLLDGNSPAGDRMLQIVGVFGVINLAAALVLLRRNHIIAWLTICPFIALLSPAIAVPFAQLLDRHSDQANVIVFHRVLFSIPSGLALVYLVESVASKPSLNRYGFSPFAFGCAVVFFLLVAPSAAWYYSRIWNTLTIVPRDLQLSDIFSKYETSGFSLRGNGETKIVSNQAGAALLSSYSVALIGPQHRKVIGSPTTDSITTALDFIHSYGKKPHLLRTTLAGAIERPDKVEYLNLVTDSKASDPAYWTVFSGEPLRFVDGIPDLPTTSTALENSPGAICEAFTANLIPIKNLSTYRFEVNVRQIRTTSATAYLAIAWYNHSGEFLQSNAPQPNGAGNPRGWSNGTYSYFGLVAQSPSQQWTNYGISFGSGEDTAIPVGARFIRVGAILNSNIEPAAIIQLTDVRLVEKKTPHFALAITDATSTYSPSSQVAQLSLHWLPQQATVERAGTTEVLSAATAVDKSDEIPDQP